MVLTILNSKIFAGSVYISSQVVVMGPCGDMLGAYYDLKYVV